MEQVRGRSIGQYWSTCARGSQGVEWSTLLRSLRKKKLHLRVEMADKYYPVGVSARFEIRWYQNEDFNFHYQEIHQDGVWKCRWDRHPNTHNSRGHFHPPPTASRIDAEDAQWPIDHRDVCQIILEYVRKRIEGLWD